MSHHGDEVALAPCLDLEDGKAVLGIVVGDALDRSGESFERCSRLRGRMS